MRLAVLQSVALWVVLLALGTIALTMSGVAASLPGGRLAGALGPRTVPLFVFNAIGALAALVAVVEAIAIVKQRRANKAEHAPAAGDAANAKMVSLWPLLVVLAAVVSFAAAWRALGFLTASAALVAVLGYVLAPAGRRSLLVSAVLAIAFTTAIWLLFRFVLSVPLPGGTKWGL